MSERKITRAEMELLLDAMTSEQREAFAEMTRRALDVVTRMCEVMGRWTDAGIEAAEQHANEETR